MSLITTLVVKVLNHHHPLLNHSAPAGPPAPPGTSLLSTIFRGTIKSCVKAKGVRSAAPSITVQPFTMLHLDILDSVRSVEDALDRLTHAETIHGGTGMGLWSALVGIWCD